MTRKTNSSIGTATDAPRLRLKALRKEIQLTQEKLAARCGMSYPYILAVETGRLPLTSSLAEAVSCANRYFSCLAVGQRGWTFTTCHTAGSTIHAGILRS